MRRTITIERDFPQSRERGPHVRMEHSGFAGLKLVLVSFIMEMGWKRSVLPRLGKLLA